MKAAVIMTVAIRLTISCIELMLKFINMRLTILVTLLSTTIGTMIFITGGILES